MTGARSSYRWLLVAALVSIVNVSYGVTFYAFSVLLEKDAAAGDLSRVVLSASLALAVVVSGVLALLVGTLCDVHGPRGVLLAGAVLGAGGLAAFSRSGESWQAILSWAFLLGPAMACTFYEPAYVAIDQWFKGRKGKAFGVLTVLAGLSATIFLPLTHWLVATLEWGTPSSLSRSSCSSSSPRLRSSSSATARDPRRGRPTAGRASPTAP